MTSEKSQCVNLFCGIYGVGPKIAEDFYDLGARTLKDLARIPGIKLTRPQKLGVKYYEDLQQRIPRPEVQQLYGIACEVGTH